MAARFAQMGLAPSSVYLTEYWDATRDDFPPALGGPYSPFCKADQPAPGIPPLAPSSRARRYGHDALVAPLNATVAGAAAAHGWQFVSGVQSAFDGHGICANASRWIVTGIESNDHEGSSNGAWHANTLGQNAIANILLARLNGGYGLAGSALIAPARVNPAPKLRVRALPATHRGSTVSLPVRGLAAGRFRLILSRATTRTQCSELLGHRWSSVGRASILRAPVLGVLRCATGNRIRRALLRPGRYVLSVARLVGKGPVATPIMGTIQIR